MGEGGAHAQEAGDEAQVLPPIDVTGQPPADYRRAASRLGRLPAGYQDTPQSISVVPEELIREQTATTVRDALRNVPGISLNAGEGGQQADIFTIRGYTARGDVFIDGLRDIGQYTRDSFNLESIEVLKGPSSVLFGRGSTGGLINQVTKEPRPEPFAAGSFTLGSSLSRRGTADINQPLTGSIGLRLNAMAHDVSTVGRDEVEQRRWGIAPSLAFGMNGPTRLTLDYLHQEENNVPDYGLPYLEGRPADVDDESFYGFRDDDFEKTRVDVATARLEHELNDALSLRSTTRYGLYDRKFQGTAPRLAGFVPGTPLDEVLVNRGRPTKKEDDTVLGNQTDLTARFATGPLRHTALLGVELVRETVEVRSFAWSGLPQTGLESPNPSDDDDAATRTQSARRRAEALTAGAYLSDQIELGEHWALQGAVRLDHFAADVNDKLNDQKLSQSETMPSYRAGLVYKPLEELSLYAAYGTSFNPSAEYLALSAANEDTDPEETRSFELGAKLDLLDGALSLTGAVFRIEKTDARTVDPVDASVTVLDGESRVDGLEIGAVGRILPWWNVFAGYTWLDSEVERSNNPDEEGRELINTPEHQLSLWTTVDFLDRWQVGGGVYYVASRFGNTTNTNKVGDYWRFDAALAYAPVDSLELRLNVLNLTDEDYLDQVYSGHAVPGAGRTFLLTTSFRF